MGTDSGSVMAHSVAFREWDSKLSASKVCGARRNVCDIAYHVLFANMVYVVEFRPIRQNRGSSLRT